MVWIDTVPILKYILLLFLFYFQILFT